MVPLGGSRWIAAAPGDRMTTGSLMCQLRVAPVASEAGPSVSLPVPENTWLSAAGNSRGSLGALGLAGVRDFAERVPAGEADRLATCRPAAGCETGGLRLATPLRTGRAPAPATLLAGA